MEVDPTPMPMACLFFEFQVKTKSKPQKKCLFDLLSESRIYSFARAAFTFSNILQQSYSQYHAQNSLKLVMTYF